MWLLVLAIAVSALLASVTWGAAEATGKSFNDAAKTLQALGTLAAILAGGVFALYKLQVFRDFQPHLTITHEISHRRIGESYVHLDVAATLHNSSKTHVEVSKVHFVLSMISPVTDGDVDDLYAKALHAESSSSAEG